MSNKSILQSNNEALSANNLDLQTLLDQANALPDAGGVELPELSNEGSANDVLSGKQLISQDGEVVTGTFSIDSELSAQDELISQIQAAVDGLPEAGTGGSSGNIELWTGTVSTLAIGGADGGNQKIYYTDSTLTFCEAILPEPIGFSGEAVEITIPVNTIIFSQAGNGVVYGNNFEILSEGRQETVIRPTANNFVLEFE